MRIAIITFALVVSGLCFNSCDKEDFKLNSFGNCPGGVLTDSLAIATNVPGLWQWTEQLCMCCEGSKPTKADKDVTVTFLINQSYSLSENESVVGSGTWSVQPTTEGYVVVLSTDAKNETHYLAGSIRLCDNELLADASPNDGCRNLFIKQD